MSKSVKNTTRVDVHQDVTNRLISIMEQGVDVWKQTWRSQAALGRPINGSTKKQYTGINVFLLWLEAQKEAYQSNVWLTFKQAKDLGANVKKGMKGTSCVFYSIVQKKDSNNSDEPESYTMIKRFFVFNADQIDNLPEEVLGKKPTEEPAPSFDICNMSERFISNTGAVIHHKGSKAYYVPSTDEIYMPKREDFFSEANYYSTLFHELIHSTAHSSRLNRDFGKRFGDERYSMEELVAELGSCYLGAEFGILDGLVENHASYLDSWLKVLKSDKRAIFHAASKAQAAFDYLAEAGKLDEVLADAEEMVCEVAN